MINNDFYEELGDRWYTDASHPIALLRKENETRNPWILQTIAERLGPEKTVLDIGCGAGFLSNALAHASHHVTGIDLSAGCLKVASERKTSGNAHYMQADARELPFPDKHFDVVCVMDLLEHVDFPARVIAEASRVLKEGGLFFFHTFNRNWLSYCIVIKGVEWCLPNVPRHLHVYPLFIKPKELTSWCREVQIDVQEMKGLSPKIATLSFWKGLALRRVDEKMRFRFTSSLKMGYLGFGVKRVLGVT